MKIIITSPANIRKGATTSSEIMGTAGVGRIFDAEKKLGQNIGGNMTWYELSVGGNVWSGNAKEYSKSEAIPYSQNDWRWRFTRLGFGTSWDQTMGNYGCAITSCSMLSGIDPATLNNNLKRVNGFVNGTWLVWGALEKATSGKLRYVDGVGVPYNDIIVKDIIGREKVCILEVSGSWIPMHFVVAIGKGQILDPIDGKKKSIYTYNLVGYRDIARL